MAGEPIPGRGGGPLLPLPTLLPYDEIYMDFYWSDDQISYCGGLTGARGLAGCGNVGMIYLIHRII
jgi:hypothetical protein